jgi:hypothetical protein
MKYFIYLLFFLLLLPTASATVIKFEPATLTIHANEQKTVTIQVMPTETIDTVATDYIHWDKSILNCVGIQRGNIFNDTTIWIPGTINNDKGEIRKMVWASIYPTNESGMFITLIFTGKKDGTTKIIINETECGIARGGVNVDKTLQGTCMVTVSGTPIHPITSSPFFIYIMAILAVLVCALILVAILRRPKKKKNMVEEPEEVTEEIKNIF